MNRSARKIADTDRIRRTYRKFWDTEATGGIAVGDYLDYAWSGYNSNSEAPQLLDPWNDGLEYISSYTQKPIANMPKERYGCINFPIILPIQLNWRRRVNSSLTGFRTISPTTLLFSMICVLIYKTIMKQFGMCSSRCVALIWMQRIATYLAVEAGIVIHLITID